MILFIYLFFETEGRHANARAHEALDHLASFLSSKEEISQLGIELPTSSLRFGYLFTIIGSLGSSRTIVNMIWGNTYGHLMNT